MGKGPRVAYQRRLFFPTKADHDEGTLTGILSLNQNWFNQWALPQLSNRCTTGSADVNTRRLGFLSSLTDLQYQKIFVNMQNNPGLTCPRWYANSSEYLLTRHRRDFVRTNRQIAQPMKKVLHHIIYWTDQTFTYPNRHQVHWRPGIGLEELRKSAFRTDINPRLWRLVDEGATDMQPKFTITSLPGYIDKFMELSPTLIDQLKGS